MIFLHVCIVVLIIAMWIQINVRLSKLGEKMTEETRAIIKRFDDATNAIAAKLQTLIDASAKAGSVSEADVRAALEPIVSHLEALGADSSNPTPAPVEPAPAV